MPKIYQVELIDMDCTSKSEAVNKANDWLALNSDKVENLVEIKFETNWREKREGDTYLSGTFHTAQIVYETSPEKID